MIVIILTNKKTFRSIGNRVKNMDALTSIKAKLSELEEKRKVALEEIRKEFPTLLIPIFQKSKLITSIGWTQYTPYFNDGEECTFGVHNDSLLINGEDEYDLEWYSWKIDEYLKSGKYADEKDKWNIDEYKIVEEFKEVLSQIPEDFYKELFGDHSEVTVKADGTIATEQYEHD